MTQQFQGLNSMTEYLASQYADDTSLTLEDDPVSLERCLQIFDKFSDCACLRANLDKNTGYLV